MAEYGLKDKFYHAVQKLNSSDGLIIAAGICALVIGILVDVFAVRLLCLFVVLGSGVLLYALMHARGIEYRFGTSRSNSPDHSQVENEAMKKLVFDDLQPNANDRYIVGEIHEDGQIPTGNGSASTHTIPSVEPMRTSQRVYAQGKLAPPPPSRELQASDFFDIESDIYRGDPEPRSEFNFLLHKVLTVAKEVLFAHSAAFFWANREKNQMIVEARVSDSPGFITGRRFAIGHDLVSQVAVTGRPSLITDVNPLSEGELLPYYSRPESVKSFLGVPVFFSNMKGNQAPEQPVAVLAVDSKAADEFGQETVSLLGQFTKLVSALIKSYTDKYDLLLDSELLRSIRRLQERVRSNFSTGTIVQSLSEETSRLVSWDYVSVVLFDETRHEWRVKKVTSRAHSPYVLPEQVVSFSESLVGQTIRCNSHNSIDDLELVTTPRFFSNESLERKGSFISVPISSLNKCYGALNVESCDKFSFSRQDIEMLYRLAENAASALEILYLQEVIDEYVIIDGVTGVLSKKFFLQRLQDEIQRADDSGTELSLLFISIDKSGEIIEKFGEEGFERVILTLAKAIRSSVRPYDIVGRYEAGRFGVALVDTAANEAYVWAEKIRQNVAAHVINLGGRTFSVTISIGVCGALDGMRREELLGNTITVLDRATGAGGNAVCVF